MPTISELVDKSDIRVQGNAHANAILAEVEPLQGDLLCVALICGMWLICRVRTHCKLVGH